MKLLELENTDCLSDETSQKGKERSTNAERKMLRNIASLMQHTMQSE